MWFLANSLLYILFKFLSIYNSDTWIRLVHFKLLCLRRLAKGLVKAAEEAAQGLGSGIDGRALFWMFESLDEDHELERFFAAIPGFCNSKVVVDPLNAFTKPNDKRLSLALIGLMERTLSSNLISESVKQRRIVICRTAVDVTSLSASQQILDRALLGTWDELLCSADFALSAKRWCNESNPGITFRAKCVVAHVLFRVREHDERWLGLATNQLGISRPVLQRLIVHEDDVLLANLIFITREILVYHSDHGDWAVFYRMSLGTLEETSKFNPQRILPGLQRGFCDLWNHLVLVARNHKDLHTRSITVRMLKRIRKIYIALHGPTDDSLAFFSTSTNDAVLNHESVYPWCKTHSHVSMLSPLNMAPPFPELVADENESITDTPETFPSPVSTQALQSAHLTSATANTSHSPSAEAASFGEPSILPHK
jgi:hypothetical protein